MKTVYLENLPDCDLCTGQNKGNKAVFDVKTSLGRFANLCQNHFNIFGVNIGSKLAVTPKVKIDKPKKIKTVMVPLSFDSVVTVKCPYCSHKRSVESDANYTVNCESCNNEYKIVSMI